MSVSSENNNKTTIGKEAGTEIPDISSLAKLLQQSGCSIDDVAKKIYELIEEKSATKIDSELSDKQIHNQVIQEIDKAIKTIDKRISELDRLKKEKAPLVAM